MREKCPMPKNTTQCPWPELEPGVFDQEGEGLQPIDLITFASPIFVKLHD